jgi:hypothetical protein
MPSRSRQFEVGLGTGIPFAAKWEERPPVSVGEQKERFIEHVIDRLKPRLLLASLPPNGHDEKPVDMPSSRRLRSVNEHELDRLMTMFGGGTVSPSDEIRLLSEFNNPTTAESMPSLAELQTAVQLHFAATKSYSKIDKRELNLHIESLLTDMETASSAVK